MKQPKELDHIVISGTISGEIWWSGKAWKQFEVTYTPEPHRVFTRPWNGLREAVCDITNDGNFQHCKIDSATLTAVYYQGSKQIVKSNEINRKGKLVEDCFHPDDSGIDSHEE
jgi:hypothetical protein